MIAESTTVHTAAFDRLREAGETVDHDAIQEDQEEETESYNSTLEFEQRQAADPTYTREPAEVGLSTEEKADMTLLSDNLKKASENVIVKGTRSEYTRYWRSFKVFCERLGVVEDSDDIDAFGKNVPQSFPEWICLWIMDKADEIDIYTGKTKDPSVPRLTYGSAQKMRAAISHKFGRDYSLGTQPWSESPVHAGTFIGNPSLSVVVSQYMISLQRRRVRAGLTVTSARAMTESIMRQLFEFNVVHPPSSDASLVAGLKRKRREERPEDWAGEHIRLMLQLLYVVAMLCLLRFDEALRISWGDVRLEILADGSRRIRINLPFRKTHQTGGIAPFFLYANLEQPWMCPVLLFGKWWDTIRRAGSTPQGYVFRKRMGQDGWNFSPEEGLSADSFLECFRNNLCDLGIDPRPYGTHSFRRGGCQYLAMTLRWGFRKICDWAGWADNFDNPGTLFKYLLSWNDAPMMAREDYMNPQRPRGDVCNACGRSCDCNT